MTEVIGGLLVIVALAGIIRYSLTGRIRFRNGFGGLLSGANEEWAGGLPANVLLITTTVMFALELGVVSGGAGSGLAYALIIGAAILLALTPNIAGLVLGVLGLLWAVPEMADKYTWAVVLPILALSALATLLAGILRQRRRPN